MDTLKRNDTCLVVAEVAQGHDGSLGMAHAFIDAVANAGADAVKFQTHIAAAESTSDEPWRVKFSQQDVSRYEYWKRMEFTEDQWHGLKRHADDRGLYFLSSPFSVEAVELLTRVGVAAWKVASGEVANEPMLERMASSKLPIFLSTGMSQISEIDRAVERVQKTGLELTVLQCTSLYPTPPEKVGLNLITLFRERYGSKVGLSDHSGTIYPGIAAAALGADVVEVHVTFSKEMFGPDIAVSLTTHELRQLVEGIRFMEKVRSHPVDKDVVATELVHTRQMFHRSIVATRNLSEGTVLQPEHLSFKKPGGGLPPGRLPQLIGRKLIRSVQSDERLCESDLI